MSSEYHVARLAWAQLDQDGRSEVLAALREHDDVITPGLHARLMATGLPARAYGGPEAQSYLVPQPLKNYLRTSGPAERRR